MPVSGQMSGAAMSSFRGACAWLCFNMTWLKYASEPLKLSETHTVTEAAYLYFVHSRLCQGYCC